MNHRHEDAIDPREWEAQERALRDERAGIAAGGDDPVAARYRVVVRALRRPLPEPPPGLAGEIAAALAAGRLDTGFENRLLRGLLAVFALAAAVVVALYGGQWMQPLRALLPAGMSMGWALALAACAAVTWTMARLHEARPATD